MDGGHIHTAPHLGVKCPKNRHFQAKCPKYLNFHTVKSTIAIQTKISTVIMTAKYPWRVIQNAPHKSKMSNNHHLKKKKNDYLRNHLTNFDDLYIIQCVSTQRCIFWGLGSYCTIKFGGQMSPKPTFRAVYRHFQATMQNI